jgi:NAD(P)-dependent dehydrogenase (short-subunit alcohol dehydrogenase family)
VRANAVVPAFVPVLRNRSEQDDPARLARFPLGRYPTAQEVAAATLFLLSGQASAITGVSLPVDSGLLARLP